MDSRDELVLLFDGVCHFCNRWVRLVLNRDSRKRFRFAPLQSDAGRELLERHGLATSGLESLVLIEAGQPHVKSSAALRVARRLDGAWPILYGGILVPRPIRDAVYSWIARNRYRWFGRDEQCMVPSHEVQDRFL